MSGMMGQDGFSQSLNSMIATAQQVDLAQEFSPVVNAAKEHKTQVHITHEPQEALMAAMHKAADSHPDTKLTLTLCSSVEALCMLLTSNPQQHAKLKSALVALCNAARACDGLNKTNSQHPPSPYISLGTCTQSLIRSIDLSAQTMARYSGQKQLPLIASPRCSAALITNILHVQHGQQQQQQSGDCDGGRPLEQKTQMLWTLLSQAALVLDCMPGHAAPSEVKLLLPGGTQQTTTNRHQQNLMRAAESVPRDIQSVIGYFVPSHPVPSPACSTAHPTVYPPPPSQAGTTTMLRLPSQPENTGTSLSPGPVASSASIPPASTTIPLTQHPHPAPAPSGQLNPTSTPALHLPSPQPTHPSAPHQSPPLTIHQALLEGLAKASALFPPIAPANTSPATLTTPLSIITALRVLSGMMPPQHDTTHPNQPSAHLQDPSAPATSARLRPHPHPHPQPSTSAPCPVAISRGPPQHRRRQQTSTRGRGAAQRHGPRRLPSFLFGPDGKMQHRQPPADHVAAEDDDEVHGNTRAVEGSVPMDVLSQQGEVLLDVQGLMGCGPVAGSGEGEGMDKPWSGPVALQHCCTESLAGKEVPLGGGRRNSAGTSHAHDSGLSPEQALSDLPRGDYTPAQGSAGGAPPGSMNINRSSGRSVLALSPAPPRASIKVSSKVMAALTRHHDGGNSNNASTSTPPAPTTTNTHTAPAAGRQTGSLSARPDAAHVPLTMHVTPTASVAPTRSVPGVVAVSQTPITARLPPVTSVASTTPIFIPAPTPIPTPIPTLGQEMGTASGAVAVGCGAVAAGDEGTSHGGVSMDMEFDLDALLIDPDAGNSVLVGDGMAVAAEAHVDHKTTVQATSPRRTPATGAAAPAADSTLVAAGTTTAAGTATQTPGAAGGATASIVPTIHHISLPEPSLSLNLSPAQTQATHQCTVLGDPLGALGQGSKVDDVSKVADVSKAQQAADHTVNAAQAPSSSNGPAQPHSTAATPLKISAPNCTHASVPQQPTGNGQPPSVSPLAPHVVHTGVSVAVPAPRKGTSKMSTDSATEAAEAAATPAMATEAGPVAAHEASLPQTATGTAEAGSAPTGAAATLTPQGTEDAQPSTPDLPTSPAPLNNASAPSAHAPSPSAARATTPSRLPAAAAGPPPTPDSEDNRVKLKLLEEKYARRKQQQQQQQQQQPLTQQQPIQLQSVAQDINMQARCTFSPEREPRPRSPSVGPTVAMLPSVCVSAGKAGSANVRATSSGRSSGRAEPGLLRRASIQGAMAAGEGGGVLREDASVVGGGHGKVVGAEGQVDSGKGGAQGEGEQQPDGKPDAGAAGSKKRPQPSQPTRGGGEEGRLSMDGAGELVGVGLDDDWAAWGPRRSKRRTLSGGGIGVSYVSYVGNGSGKAAAGSGGGGGGKAADGSGGNGSGGGGGGGKAAAVGRPAGVKPLPRRTPSNSPPAEGNAASRVAEEAIVVMCPPRTNSAFQKPQPSNTRSRRGFDNASRDLQAAVACCQARMCDGDGLGDGAAPGVEETSRGAAIGSSGRGGGGGIGTDVGGDMHAAATAATAGGATGGGSGGDTGMNGGKVVKGKSGGKRLSGGKVSGTGTAGDRGGEGGVAPTAVAAKPTAPAAVPATAQAKASGEGEQGGSLGASGGNVGEKQEGKKGKENGGTGEKGSQGSEKGANGDGKVAQKGGKENSSQGGEKKGSVELKGGKKGSQVGEKGKGAKEGGKEGAEEDAKGEGAKVSRATVNGDMAAKPTDVPAELSSAPAAQSSDKPTLAPSTKPSDKPTVTPATKPTGESTAKPAPPSGTLAPAAVQPEKAVQTTTPSEVPKQGSGSMADGVTKTTDGDALREQPAGARGRKGSGRGGSGKGAASRGGKVPDADEERGRDGAAVKTGAAGAAVKAGAAGVAVKTGAAGAAVRTAAAGVTVKTGAVGEGKAVDGRQKRPRTKESGDVVVSSEGGTSEVVAAVPWVTSPVKKVACISGPVTGTGVNSSVGAQTYSDAMTTTPALTVQLPASAAAPAQLAVPAAATSAPAAPAAAPAQLAVPAAATSAPAAPAAAPAQPTLPVSNGVQAPAPSSGKARGRSTRPARPTIPPAPLTQVFIKPEPGTEPQHHPGIVHPVQPAHHHNQPGYVASTSGMPPVAPAQRTPSQPLSSGSVPHAPVMPLPTPHGLALTVYTQQPGPSPNPTSTAIVPHPQPPPSNPTSTAIVPHPQSLASPLAVLLHDQSALIVAVRCALHTARQKLEKHMRKAQQASGGAEGGWGLPHQQLQQQQHPLLGPCTWDFVSKVVRKVVDMFLQTISPVNGPGLQQDWRQEVIMRIRLLWEERKRRYGVGGDPASVGGRSSGVMGSSGVGGGGGELDPMVPYAVHILLQCMDKQFGTSISPPPPLTIPVEEWFLIILSSFSLLQAV